MRLTGLTLAGCLAALVVALPGLASAAAPAKTAPYEKEQITKGKTGVGPVLQSAGLTCTPVDAAFVGEGDAKNPDDPKAKEVHAVTYEVACQDGMGYMMQSYTGIPVKVYDCVTLAESPSPCRLPENLDTRKMMQTIVAATGKTCQINNQRAIGGNKAGDRYYEVGCAEGPGYIVQTFAPGANKPPKANGCAQAVGTNLECKFTTKEMIAQALNATASSLVAASGKTCTVTGSREVGIDSSGNIFYEIACSSGVGYMMSAKDGKFVRAIDCATAQGMAGGCTLTDPTKAESAEAATYTRLAGASGFQCQVAKYRFVGIDKTTDSEVVELQCANRPDGRVALFPTSNKGPAKFYDCVTAAARGVTCKLTDPAAAFPHYTQNLASKGKTTCKVSNAHWLGATAEGTQYVETACSDGLPGWVIEETQDGGVSQIITCGQAKGAGVACTLPGNTK